MKHANIFSVALLMYLTRGLISQANFIKKPSHRYEVLELGCSQPCTDSMTNYLSDTSHPRETIQNWKENIGKTLPINHLCMVQMLLVQYLMMMYMPGTLVVYQVFSMI